MERLTDNGKEKPVSGLSWKQAGWLGVIFAFLFSFCSFYFSDLASGDETRVAGICAQMAVEGDFIVPKLNGHPFLEYPPLFYWVAAFMMRFCGITVFALRFPVALALFLSGITGFFFAGRLRFSPWAALAAEAMILTNCNFLKMGRRAMVDLPLACCILVTMAAFYAMSTEKRKGLRPLWWLLFTAAMSAGGYTKGLLGIALPGAILGTWLMVRDLMTKKFRFFSYLSLGMGGLISLGAVALWYAALAGKGGDLLHTALIVNNLGRFSGGQGDHVGEWFYYLPRLPQMFQPYLILLLLAFWKFSGKIFRQKEEGMLLLFIASLLPLLVFQIAAAKRPVYLLPLFSFWALFTAPLADGIAAWGKRRFPAIRPMIFGIAAAVVLTAGIILFDVIYACIIAKTDGMRDCYRYLQQNEKAGKRLVLLNPSERTQGALWFYLHHGMEERFLSLEAAKNALPDNEIWLWRDKKGKAVRGERRWNDCHRTLCKME